MIKFDDSTMDCSSSIDFSYDASDIKQIDCEADDVVKVEMKISSVSNSLTGICKVLIMGERCPFVPSSAEITSSTSVSLDFDMNRFGGRRTGTPQLNV